MIQQTFAPRVFAPVLTPFDAVGGVDTRKFVSFCRWLVSQRAGLAIFGTNSEANSLSLTERLGLLDAVLEAGIDPIWLMPGTGSSALPEAVHLTRKVVDAGCGGALVLPPFYYKGASDEGVYRYYSEIVQRVGSSRLQLYLYHIPQMSGVPISLKLIERLRRDYPETVVGLKDSSGDWDNLQAMLERFPGFKIYPASEALLARALPLGATGCISATANIQPSIIANYIASTDETERTRLNERLSAVRARMQRTAMIPALKAVVGHFAKDTAWNTVRPPLVEADDGDIASLVADLRAAGFDMPGIADHAV